MIKKLLHKILWHISWNLGYLLQDKKINYIRTFGNDPRELPYLDNLPHTILSLPISKGNGLRFYKLTGNTYHPFVLALKDTHVGDMKEQAFSILKKYGGMVNLTTSNDYLGLSKGEEVFNGCNHPYEYCYPWSPTPPSENRDFLMNDIQSENNRFGFASDESLDLPNVSDRKVMIETHRLIKLMVSIQKNGFIQENDDVVGGFVLSEGDKWRWYVQGGQHRAAVMAALGYDHIPVCVRQIVRREDVCFWPSVQSGIYTEKQALIVFDRLFRSETPPVAKDWVKYVNKRFGYKALETNEFL